MKNFLKRLRWCWYILAGKKFALFFPGLKDLETTTACKYGRFNSSEWQGITDISEACAQVSFAKEFETIEDRMWQDLLLEEAKLLAARKPENPA